MSNTRVRREQCLRFALTSKEKRPLSIRRARGYVVSSALNNPGRHPRPAYLRDWSAHLFACSAFEAPSPPRKGSTVAASAGAAPIS